MHTLSYMVKNMQYRTSNVHNILVIDILKLAETSTRNPDSFSQVDPANPDLPPLSWYLPHISGNINSTHMAQKHMKQPESNLQLEAQTVFRVVNFSRWLLLRMPASSCFISGEFENKDVLFGDGDPHSISHRFCLNTFILHWRPRKSVKMLYMFLTYIYSIYS